MIIQTHKPTCMDRLHSGHLCVNFHLLPGQSALPPAYLCPVSFAFNLCCLPFFKLLFHDYKIYISTVAIKFVVKKSCKDTDARKKSCTVKSQLKKIHAERLSPSPPPHPHPRRSSIMLYCTPYELHQSRVLETGWCCFAIPCAFNCLIASSLKCPLNVHQQFYNGGHENISRNLTKTDLAQY